MVYYNIINTNEDKDNTNNDGTSLQITVDNVLSPPSSKSKSSIRYSPLKAVDKRAVYSCLKKMQSEMNRQPELQLRCVEQASICKENIKSFQEWLEKEMYVIFTEEEVRGLLDYILLHSWGHVIIKDITFLRKLFEVPTPLNYSSWFSNIDNMQIRSQFRNSLMQRPERHKAGTGTGGGYQQLDVNNAHVNNSNMSPPRIRILPDKIKEGKEVVAMTSKESSKLEQLQQKYLNRNNSTSTLYLTSSDSPPPSTITYLSPTSKRGQQVSVSMFPLTADTDSGTNNGSSPLPKLLVQSKQKALTRSQIQTQTQALTNCKRFSAEGMQVVDLATPVKKKSQNKSGRYEYHRNADTNNNNNTTTTTRKKGDRNYNEKYMNNEYNGYHTDANTGDSGSGNGCGLLITPSPVKEKYNRSGYRKGRATSSSSSSISHSQSHSESESERHVAPRALPPSPIRKHPNYYMSPAPSHSHSHSQATNSSATGSGSGGGGGGSSDIPSLIAERRADNTHNHSHGNNATTNTDADAATTHTHELTKSKSSRSMVIQIPRVYGMYTNEM